LHEKKDNALHVRASFNVERKVLDEFRKLVVQKYGQLWGCLHLEFKQALVERAQILKNELEASSSE